AGALIPGAGAHVPFEQLLQGFDFVYIGVGLGGSHKLNIPGENMECVLSAEDFLSGVNSGEKIDFSGKKIAVIGAGNTAMDSACASKRLGAKAVTVIYRRSAEEMPAWKNEYESAVEEGVEFMWLTQPVEITTESELKCVRTTLGEKDASGRRSPVPVPGSDFLIQVDIILKALGQKPDTVFINKMADAFKIQTKNGLIIIDEKTCRTTNPRIFAGGDCANGGLTAVEAVACGKRAATSIIAASIVAAFITNEPLA
ncbi:MAG: FAD-dependent oxidoreductase, partial [Elusimicrobiota bacterium]